MKTTVHIISHSHWDREWYQSFEKHRMKLIELVDNILEKAENDPEFGGFFLEFTFQIGYLCFHGWTDDCPGRLPGSAPGKTRAGGKMRP